MGKQRLIDDESKRELIRTSRNIERFKVTNRQ